MLAARQHESQQITAITGDMGVAESVRSTLSITLRPAEAYSRHAPLLRRKPNSPTFFIAWRVALQLNEDISSTLSLISSNVVLKRWTEDDATNGEEPSLPRSKEIVFVNSSASFIPTLGYVAYSAAEAVQCVFAHNFVTPTFLEEQTTKPDLTKRIEGASGIDSGSAVDISALEGRFPSAEKTAPEIVAVASDDFAVLDKRLEPQVL
ncbi:hypothetical protein F4818DRAFT_436742 [Hypoxylon cercidicola]|nr:hypothetical protein F4818DRAFT_436742 [Hypoxylon cercidicola]